MAKKLLFVVLLVVLVMMLSACEQGTGDSVKTVKEAIRASNSLNDFMSNSQVMAIELNNDIVKFMGRFGVTVDAGMKNLGDLLMSLPEADLNELWNSARSLVGK